MSIAKKLNLSVMDWHEFLGKMERLDARELNLLAMQLINRNRSLPPPFFSFVLEKILTKIRYSILYRS
jgi:hypothetical protein